jgi:hypothetical protein
MTRPDRIRRWVSQQFNPKHVDRVTADLIDAATGNRQGNSFEQQALERIFPEDRLSCEHCPAAGGGCIVCR